MSLRRVDPADFTSGSGEGSAAVVAGVRRAALAADGQDPLDEAAVLQLKHHGLDGAALWLSGSETAGGFALRRGAELDLAVAPAGRGHGLGAALAEAGLAAPGPVTAWSHGDHPAAAALAKRFGLERAREMWVMRRRDLSSLPALVVPDDVGIRGFEDGDRDEVLRINAAAFAHHPEQGAMDAAHFDERTAEDWFEPAGLLVAEDLAAGPGAGLIGFHWTKRRSDEEGEVYVVGIDPEAQGRGLGRALTLAGLHHLADAGVREILLFVESDNAAAVHVYSGLGFTHEAVDTHVQYRR